MKAYSFLVEAVPVQQVNARPVAPNPLMQQAMGFNSVFKPISIPGISLKTRNGIMAQANAKLRRINMLTAKLQRAASDPSNKNVQTDRMKLKYAQDAYKIHHEFVSKTIFWRSRVKMNMGPQFAQLKEQYTRSLFTLEQAYKRSALQLNPADTSNY